jgi:hypothetical protein
MSHDQAMARAMLPDPVPVRRRVCRRYDAKGPGGLWLPAIRAVAPALRVHRTWLIVLLDDVGFRAPASTFGGPWSDADSEQTRGG